MIKKISKKNRKKSAKTPTIPPLNSGEYKNLTPEARREKLKDLIGFIKVSTIAPMFGVETDTIYNDIKAIGEEEISHSVKEKLLAKDESINSVMQRRIQHLLDSANPNAVIGAVRTLLEIQKWRVKCRQDLGILELPTQKVENSLSVDAVTFEDFQRAYDNRKEKKKIEEENGYDYNKHAKS